MSEPGSAAFASPVSNGKTEAGQAVLVQLLETSPDCIKILDLEGRLTLMSAGGARAMEIDNVAGILGQAWTGFWQGVHHGAAVKGIEDAKAGRPARFQGFCPTMKGVPKWWDVIISPVSGLDGRPEKLLVVSRDVTDRVRLEQDLRETGERYRAIVESGATLVWTADAKGQVVGGSTARWQAICGQSFDEHSGRGWLDVVHPEDRERVVKAWEASIADPRPTTKEYRVRNLDGSYRWMRSVCVPIFAGDGSVREWIGTTTDIHDRKLADDRVRESEARYRALVEATASACWAASPDGSVTEFFGLGDQSEGEYEGSLGVRWLDAVHPDDRGPAFERWQAALAQGVPLASEYRLRVEGRYRWVRVRGVPRHGPEGDIREWVGTVTDITAQRDAENARRSTEERYRLAARATRDAIWDWDLATDELGWGEATGSVFGFGADNLGGSGQWWIERIHPDDRNVVLDRVKKALEGSSEFSEGEYRFRRGDGSYANVLDRGYIIRDEEGRAIRMVGAMQDLSERTRAQDTLKGSEERLRLALRAGRMVAWNLHVPTQYVTRGDTGLSVLGMTSGPFAEFLERIPEEDRPRLQSYLAGLGSDPFATAEFRFRSPTGKLLWLGTRAERSGEDEIVGVTFDITDRKRVEEEVWRVANHDPLTGLPNRALLKLRLEKVLADAKRDGTSVSLLMIDLDDFKDINDSLGHDAGDAVLRESARRLSAMVRDSDIVARLGGDEFAIVLVEPLRLEHAVRFAETVLQALKQPFEYKGAKLSTSASIGLAAYPDHDDAMQELTMDADIALYQAKRAGRDRAVTFSSTLRKNAEDRFHLLGEFREALEANRIVPFYQPKVCLRTGEIIGFEALARWLHPARGVLTPGSFEAAFDHPELSGRIGECLIRQVARDLRSWLDNGLDPGRVAVNFSSAEFAHADLADRVLGALETAGVPTSSFEVEVTETVFLGRNSEQTAATLKRLHVAGIQIALDDFGTGFASLAHLKQFPVDHIKIDQSFVRNLEQNSDDAAIVRAVIGLGRSLGLQVTAEGVETPAQADLLRAKGCDYAQGYLYAKPMPAARATLLLQGEARDVPLNADANGRRVPVQTICSDAA